jgi:hypothetical protein
MIKAGNRSLTPPSRKIFANFASLREILFFSRQDAKTARKFCREARFPQVGLRFSPPQLVQRQAGRIQAPVRLLRVGRAAEDVDQAA